MKLITATLLIFAMSAFSATKPNKGEIEAAGAAIGKAEKSSGEMLLAGRLDDLVAAMTAVFPMATRTPVQAFMLGNALYDLEPAISYALHKEAFEKLVDYPNAALEWAMQQHRKGEHAGALAAYDLYSKSNPDFAPAHGLAADCLIQLGKVPEACARWKKSENASSGTIATFESLVCAIYKDTSFHRKRSDLRKKAEQGDAQAAADLIQLDGSYEHDWWNTVPHGPYLQKDIPLLKKTPESPLRKSAECAGELLLESSRESADEPPDEVAAFKESAKKTEAILKKYGFILDPSQTLPTDGDTMSVMLGAVTKKKLLKIETARKQFGPALLKQAETSHDAELHNVLATLYAGTPEMEGIEKRGWELAGEARFAAGYLVELLSKEKLTASTPELLAAMKQFPESSVIFRIAMEVTPEPAEELLVRAIKSEYHKFSPSGLYAGTDVNLRARATALRRYFAQLAKLQK